MKTKTLLLPSHHQHQHSPHLNEFFFSSRPLSALGLAAVHARREDRRLVDRDRAHEARNRAKLDWSLNISYLYP
jgi:hypothetical protein